MAAGALAGAAAAKAPAEGIEICGLSGCRTIVGADAERIVIVALTGSDARPATPAPSYLVRWAWPGQERRVWWVPRGGLVRDLAGGWASQSVTSEAALHRAAAGLRPFPTPCLSRVVVAGRIAENPQSYLRLLGDARPAGPEAYDRARGWLPVALTSLEPSPWTNGVSWLEVARAGPWIRLEGSAYRIDPVLAQRAHLGHSLTPFSRPG